MTLHGKHSSPIFSISHSLLTPRTHTSSPPSSSSSHSTQQPHSCHLLLSTHRNSSSPIFSISSSTQAVHATTFSPPLLSFTFSPRSSQASAQHHSLQSPSPSHLISSSSPPKYHHHRTQHHLLSTSSPRLTIISIIFFLQLHAASHPFNPRSPSLPQRSFTSNLQPHLFPSHAQLYASSADHNHHHLPSK